MTPDEAFRAAQVHHLAGRAVEAERGYREVLARNPNHSDALHHLGVLARQLGQPDIARELIERSIALEPQRAYYYNNLGNVFTDLGRLDQAIGAYRQTLQLDPSWASVHSNLLFSLIFNGSYDGPAMRQASDEWNRRHAERFRAATRAHGNDRSPERRLRIGYLSPYFWNHCQSFFTVPLFTHHDREAFEIFAYDAGGREDNTTRHMQSLVHSWRGISGVNDDEAAELIRRDGIDILIDLAMHMTGNRILVFAQPAPVQITWLAYPGTTGLPAMDYRITDPFLDPPGEHEDWYVEKSIRLPETFWCYDPLAWGIPVSELPAVAAGHVTFGCFNNAVKLNDETFRLWGEVLKAVPGSKLIVLVPPGSTRAHALEVFAGAGIGPERIEMVGRMERLEYLLGHQRVDLALDPYPCPGHTSTLDALWMGVPVIHLPGRTAVGRGGISILTNAGLSEFIAKDRGDYVRIAAGWAGELSRLAELRAGLRGHLEKSPLMDAPRFVRNMEAAYRGVWRQWCRT